jgi:anionic cell wall polymer biosynthesis LytR-Cps2A-Psr (LCP) family protein
LDRKITTKQGIEEAVKEVSVFTGVPIHYYVETKLVTVRQVG